MSTTTNDDLAIWMAMCVGAWRAMSPDLRADLAAWEAENLGERGTSEWPQWETILGRPAPAPDNRSRRQKAPISAKLRTQVYERDQYRCRHCGTWSQLSVDHVVAETNGGPTTLANLQTLCMPCNILKGTT